MAKRRNHKAFMLAFALAAGTLQAGYAAPADGAAPTAASAKEADKNPEAIAALEHMSSYLRDLKVFQVTAVVTRDDVLDDGELIQYDTQVRLLAKRPDRLQAETSNTRAQRAYFYDGKSFTLYAERANLYATVAAPATIGLLVDEAADKLGIELPLVDLFYWGGTQSKIGEISGAIDVGPAVVDGVTCEQFAFRQPGINWQIWIQQGEFPLPLKLVISTLTDEARPQYSAVMRWNLAPSYNDASFHFDPPPGSQKVVFAEADTTGAKK